jgi:hypothetical protein
MARKLANDERDLTFVVALKRAKTNETKLALVMTLDELEAADAERARLNALWWAQGLLKRAPVLSGGDGTHRGGKMYGLRSNYGRLHLPRMSGKEFYEHFRFTREDIPRLVLALRMPAMVRTPCGCALDGEEALLLFLKVLIVVVVHNADITS